MKSYNETREVTTSFSFITSPSSLSWRFGEQQCAVNCSLLNEHQLHPAGRTLISQNFYGNSVRNECSSAGWTGSAVIIWGNHQRKTEEEWLLHIKTENLWMKTQYKTLGSESFTRWLVLDASARDSVSTITRELGKIAKFFASPLPERA